MKLTDRTLVVAAHPDDEVLGCGGTIARIRRDGGDVRVIFLAEGVTARYAPEEFEKAQVQAEIDARNANAFKALALLGVPEEQVFVSEHRCCRLDTLSLIDLTKEIEGHIKDFQPRRIYSHWAHDPNIDHQVTHQALLPAVRPIRRGIACEVYAIEILSSTEWNPTLPFLANAFVSIGELVEDKIAALAAYGAEMHVPPHSRSAEVMRAAARFRGAQCGVDYAEAFSLIRRVED